MADERSEHEALLSHVGWVRDLARGLTRDAHAADDLAQDALTAALAHPPPAEWPLRRWLAAVVRNLELERRRGAGRRAARERAVAGSEASDSASAKLLEHLELHRLVVDAVARLDEPYRSAILLRYFEGLSPAEIGERTGAPLRTVHTRLHRALQRLRADLDRAHGGDRKAWLLALVPLAKGSGGSSAAAIGALVMDAKLKVALAAIALVGIGTTFFLQPSTSPEIATAPLAAGPTPAVLAREAEAPEPLVEPARTAERRAHESAATASAAAVVPAKPAAALRGFVIDVERARVPGVVVRFVGPAHGSKDGVETQTDAHGTFELADPGTSGRLEIASPGWTSVMRPELANAADAKEYVLVVARAVKLAGVVQDEYGKPVDGADVGLDFPFELRTRYDVVLDASSTVPRQTRSDADGRFELADVPVGSGAQLTTMHAAHLGDVRPVPTEDELALEIVLRSAVLEPMRLVGTVVDLENAPVADAWVGVGSMATKTGPSGTFALGLSVEGHGLSLTSGDSSVLRAVKPGHLPAELERPSDGVWPSPVVLRLGGAPLAITGRVVDGSGAPVAGAEVWTSEESPFGFVSAGGGEMSMSVLATVESILRGETWSRRTKADAEGRFELRGLLARDYRVLALDKRRVLATGRIVAAGTRNVEIRLPNADELGRVAGRVTSLAGEPVAGARVVLGIVSAGVQATETEKLESDAVIADEDGRFEFTGVSRRVNQATVSAEEIDLSGFRHAIAPGADLEKLEIVAPLRVRARIEGPEDADYDGVEILDSEGTVLQLSVFHGSMAFGMSGLNVTQGRSEPFSVSEAATTLVLKKAGAEVRRVPLRLVRGELNVLRP